MFYSKICWNILFRRKTMKIRYSWCSHFLRYLLITLNTILAIISIGVVGFELWILFDANFETQTRENISNKNPNPIEYYTVKEQIRTAVWIIFFFSICKIFRFWSLFGLSQHSHLWLWQQTYLEYAQQCLKIAQATSYI